MATIKFRLSSKADKTTGQSEVLIRFFHGRIDQYAKTNIFVNPERWNPVGERVTVPRFRVMSPEAIRVTAELTDINARLEQVKEFVTTRFNEAGAGKVQLPGSWLADLLKEYNFPTMPESRRVLDMIDRFSEQREVSASNVNHGKAVFRAFRRFLIFKGSPDLEVDEVTPDTLRSFTDYLRKEHTYFDIKEDDNGGRSVVFLNSSFKRAFNAVPESRLPGERGQNAINKFLEQLRTFLFGQTITS